MSDLTPDEFAVIQSEYEYTTVLQATVSALGTFMQDIHHTADPENTKTNGLTFDQIVANQAGPHAVLRAAIVLALANIAE